MTWPEDTGLVGGEHCVMCEQVPPTKDQSSFHYCPYIDDQPFCPACMLAFDDLWRERFSIRQQYLSNTNPGELNE